MLERKQVLQDLESLLDSGLVGSLSHLLYQVKASNGIGNAAKVPWVRFFTLEQSPSARVGWYVVLLFAADGSSASLSLNLGVQDLTTSQIKQQVDSARRILSVDPDTRDSPLRNRASSTIDLADRGLGAKYEKGNVLAFTYSAEQIPDDASFLSDLSWLIQRLERLPSAAEYQQSSWAEPSLAQLTKTSSAMDTLLRSIHLSEERVLELFEGLMDESPQIILAGPPGTGKSFVAQHLAAFLLNMPGEVKNNPYIEIVQFHPSYGYEDFVEGLRPAPAEAGLLEFRAQAGVVLRLADDIEADGQPRVLIIDEMNRANIPRVFGELMFLLEYRDHDIRLMHRERFSLPKNLYVIATMNTSDRSTQSMDVALRRRFDFFELAPDVTILRKHYASPENENLVGDSLFDGFEDLNRELVADMGDRHHQIGHSYLMRRSMSPLALKRTWDQQLAPLLEDYFFDRPEVAEAYTSERFWPDV